MKSIVKAFTDKYSSPLVWASAKANSKAHHEYRWRERFAGVCYSKQTTQSVEGTFYEWNKCMYLHAEIEEAGIKP